MRPLSGIILGIVCIAAMGRAQEPTPFQSIKPYRALIVVSHWSDPSSVVVDHEKDSFQPVAALLKAWSVPFDVFRLDQQNLDASYLFTRSARIRYGVVIWMADLDSYAPQDLPSLVDAVNAGTGLIVLHSRILDPSLEKILGLRFKDVYTSTDSFTMAQPHFITRELTNEMLGRINHLHNYSTRLWVKPEGAEVLISQGQYPVLTVNQSASGSPAIWMGMLAPSDLRDSALWRGLFQRSMLLSMGYLVRPNVDYSKTYILLEDDWGDIAKAFTTYWRYREPDQEIIQKYLIAPLQKHHAVIGADVCSGFVDRKTRRVVVPWEQKFVDRFGVQQDYPSTYRGLKDAVAAGVMEIQSHGWTHMQPDLESPPGPWWTADPDGLGINDGWWQEFGDPLRHKEVPAIAQRYFMTRSHEELEHDFGQSPLLEMIPGGSWSKSYDNNSPRITAHLGFGMFDINESVFYLDNNLVLDMYGIAPGITDAYDRLIRAGQWPAHSDGPLMIISHDRDIALSPGHSFLEQLFADLPPGLENLTPNQYIGLLHTQIRSSAGGNAWSIAFNFPEPNCRYFAQHPSSWQLWLSDPLLNQLKSLHQVNISIDGKAIDKPAASLFSSDKLILEIPSGTGSHAWSLEAGKDKNQP